MPKGIRKPVSPNPKVANKNIRKGMARAMRLDSEIYEKIHAGKKLLKITDSGSELHWWLQNGAEPVERQSAPAKIFAGINDKFASGYVTWPSGTKADGSPELTYLLMIDPDVYDELVTVPNEQRQADIMEAMKLGADQSGLERHLKGGGSIQTYAPNLPVGDGRGYNEIR